MKPHNFYAPALPKPRRSHVAVFQDKDLVGCSCGKDLAGDDAYRLHLKGRTG